MQRYFSVEPNDVLHLNNPQTEIIDKGGFIYYASYYGVIAGTATLLPVAPNVFELGKMAVTQVMQGKGIGAKLLEFCIDKAIEFNAKKLILYSNTKLTAAIGLYKKFDFYEVPLKDSSYARSNIKMEKQL